MLLKDVRNQFVKHYQSHGFQLLPRASMLHPSIPMSFVMSAGLVQVEASLSQVRKDVGNACVLIQNCFRHFDLDMIGKDNVHLSLFEMPGAFVFEGHSKRDTIAQMWQLATRSLSIDPERIWTTYFQGDNVIRQSREKDLITYQTWRELGVPHERIVGLKAEHNYWVQGGILKQVGETIRKAGPNTELFYDLGEHLVCGPLCLPGCRCGRFVEFANSLFISYQYDPQKKQFLPLDRPFFETVIGAERVAMISQGVSSVFDIADYRHVQHVIKEFITNKDLSHQLQQTSLRVVFDHLRALYMLVADGAPPPGKNGRERIIKLLIRRVMSRQIILGIQASNFLSVVLNAIAPTFADERVNDTTNKIETYFAKETMRFEKTITRGMRKLDMLLAQNSGGTLTGNQVLELEKQWGLPPILIESALRQKELSFAQKDYQFALKNWADVGKIAVNGNDKAQITHSQGNLRHARV